MGRATGRAIGERRGDDRRRSGRFAVGLACVVLVAAGCSSDGDDGSRSAASTTTTTTKASGSSDSGVTKAAWVYVGPTNDGGWTQAHDAGRKAAAKELGDSV
mgnify:CR=1 FL=1